MSGIPKFCPVDEFPWYLACSDGYVINTDTGHVITGSAKKTGYMEILMRDGEGNPHYRLLHRVIAKAFIENAEHKPEVNHIDGNKQNNAAENLEWVTREENLQHAFDTGLMPNDTTPRKIRATDIETGEQIEFPSIYQAAKATGISKGNICLCCKGGRPTASGYVWRYVDGE